MSHPGRPYRRQPYAPGYAPPGYSGPWAGAAPRTNTMAILAMIFAFVMPVLGIVFGVVARRQIDRSGEEGHGLATAGLVIGIVYSVLLLVAFVAYAVFFVLLVTQVQHHGSDLGPFPSPFSNSLSGALGA